MFEVQKKKNKIKLNLKKIYRERILHGGAKIWILFSSGKNNILRTSAASE